VLSGCAAFHPTTLECSRETARERGLKDGASGRRADSSFLKTCNADSRAPALGAYREGFETTRPKHKASREESDEEDDAVETLSVKPVAVPSALPAPRPVREPSALSWVCEVEANSKVFTGVGGTREEALGSARSTCGSHFQASYCTKADCKQSL
jgi:hypothetical protein